MSSKESKKIRLDSETDQCENQNEEESDRSAESFQSLNFKLEDLPDEVILKVFSYLENNTDRIRSGHVSQRLRAISSDESLWHKVNFFKETVPTSFIQFVLEKGCRFLSLCQTSLHGSLNLTKPTKLKHLNLNLCVVENVKNGTLQELVAACHSLENLTLCVGDQYCSRLSKFNMIETLCRQNKQTLKVFYFKFFQNYMNSDIAQCIAYSCRELKEVSIIGKANKGVSHEAIKILVDNLSPNVEKLRLEMRGITDEHVKVLVKKCNKLTDLILESKYITNKSVTNIKEHLPNLEKLKCFKLEN